MFLRGLLAVTVLIVGAVLSVRFFMDFAPSSRITEDSSSVAGLSTTIALAPISLGNPAAAATLRTRHPGTPASQAAAPAAFRQTLRVGRGDTLMPMLVEAGVPRNQAHAAITALAKVYSPRRIKPGQAITLSFLPDAEAPAEKHFVGLTLDVDFAREVNVRRAAGKGFVAAEVEKALTTKLVRTAGIIENNLFDAATDAATPLAVLIDLIHAFSWDVDFQRDIQPGDGFEVVFHRFFDAQEKPVHDGRIAFAVLTLSGARNAIYAHTTGDGRNDFFDELGQSARKALLRTPIDGARLSSRYGRRKHPILGFNKMHRGLDFAAPRGTPIYAAGNGTVDHAGRKGAYGKYVRIRHSNGYATAYAHMSRYARGMRRGKRVDQGQVIGYVGSTGRSTGPHLHYEIMQGGRQVNPMRVKMPSGRKLEGEELKRFLAAKTKIDAQVAALASETSLADAATPR